MSRPIFISLKDDEDNDCLIGLHKVEGFYVRKGCPNQALATFKGYEIVLNHTIKEIATKLEGIATRSREV